jgi:DNA-binding NarL/FixJ family response regulator
VLAYETALEHLLRGFALARELSSPLWICNIGGSLIELHSQLGDIEQARAVMDEVAVHIRDGDTLHARTALVGSVVLSLAAGDPTTAIATLQRIDTPAATSTQRLVPPLLLKLRGEALTALGQVDEAERALQAAVAHATERGNAALVWRCRAALARLYVANRRHALARGESDQVLASIAELSQQLDADRLREQFVARAASLLPQPRVPTALQAAKGAFDGLTAREVEVASLVARGMTNRAIASALTVSERTVESHLSSILAKLNANSRAQVATWAVEKGVFRSGERDVEPTR